MLDEATDDIVPEYIPPFMVLMHEAVGELEIHSRLIGLPVIEAMTAYFTGKTVEGSKPISPLHGRGDGDTDLHTGTI